MVSHFSSIGFDIESEGALLALSEQVAELSVSVPVAGGRYLHWEDPSGAALWLQLDEEGDLVGVHPHFSGSSRMRVGLQSKLTGPEDTRLDGAFRAWAAPETDDPETGAYPFVFDAPDAALHQPLVLPSRRTAQVATFAHDLDLFDSEAEHAASQSEGIRMSSRSIIPLGDFRGGDAPRSSRPAAHAVIVGHVIEAALRFNTLTGRPFWWALVDSFGGSFDLVADPTLIDRPFPPGGVVAGAFWLSGQLQRGP
ncbi:MAG: hypothetical protein AAFZ18_09515 [Myxococcota bacterium]